MTLLKIKPEYQKIVVGYLREFFTSSELVDRLNNREYIKDLATHNYKVSMFADAKRRSDWSDCHDYIDNLLWDLDYKHGYRLPF